MGEVEALKEQIEELNKKLAFFESSQKNIIKEALREFSQEKKDPLKSEFDRKFKRNKKTIIKQKIVETIKEKPISLADLKYHIVDQLAFCSKASFYRYMEELKPNFEIINNIIKIKEEVLV